MIFRGDSTPHIYQCARCCPIHSFTSSARQAVIRAEIFTGFGNDPDATRRHSVADENGRQCINCFCLINPVSGMIP